MLGDDEMIAPWGRAPPRANRAWQVSRSKSPNMRVSTWTPTVPNYLRCASPDVGHLRDQANSRAEGLRVASKVDREDTSSDVPAIGLTPTELAERQAKRGKLAMMRVAREQAIAKEGTALVAEKRAYARALGFSDSIRYSGKEDVISTYPTPHEGYGYLLNGTAVPLAKRPEREQLAVVVVEGACGDLRVGGAEALDGDQLDGAL